MGPSGGLKLDGDLLAYSSMAICLFTGLFLGSPGLLVKPMSSLFRSLIDRASVTVEENYDGRGTWGRDGTLVHRPGRR
jgi:hypothetical protein